MRRMKRFIESSSLYVLILLVSLIFLFPCIWLILASFSRSGTIYSFKGFFQNLIVCTVL